MTINTLKGYILEEVLACLLYNSGFSLIFSPKGDDNLKSTRIGLSIKGRSTVHQVDVLGELEWIPAFTYPIRLITEAKFRKGKIGVAHIRQAIGALEDINQNVSFDMTSKENETKQYTYMSALFSTSGFEKEAIKLAIAHNISVIDLSGEPFQHLLNSIDEVARSLQTAFNGQINMKHIRVGLRGLLQALIENNYFFHRIEYDSQIRFKIEQNIEPLLKEIRSIGDLFIGSVEAPFLLVLKPERKNEFQHYLDSHANEKHIVDIKWSREVNNGKTWYIVPEGQEVLQGGFTLGFQLPNSLLEAVFSDPVGAEDRAFDIKDKYLKKISIYLRGIGEDRVVKLLFNPNQRSTQTRSPHEERVRVFSGLADNHL